MTSILSMYSIASDEGRAGDKTAIASHHGKQSRSRAPPQRPSPFQSSSTSPSRKKTDEKQHAVDFKNQRDIQNSKVRQRTKEQQAFLRALGGKPSPPSSSMVGSSSSSSSSSSNGSARDEFDDAGEIDHRAERNKKYASMRSRRNVALRDESKVRIQSRTVPSAWES